MGTKRSDEMFPRKRDKWPDEKFVDTPRLVMNFLSQ